MLHRHVFIIQQHIRLCQRVPRKDHDPQRRRWRRMFADGRKSLDITPVVKMILSFCPVKIRSCIFRSWMYKPFLLSATSIKISYDASEYLINKFKNNNYNKN